MNTRRLGGWTALLAMTWPMTLRSLMLHGILVIDAWLVAVLGEGALAAMGLATAIGGLLLGAQMAFANAAQILVAQSFGSGREIDLRTSFLTGLAINLGVCAIGLVLFALAADPILRASGQDAAVLDDARRYLWIFTGVIVAEAVGQSLSAHFNGCGETRVPFYSYLFSIPVNVGLSYALIHGLWGLPQMGLAGAALGSVVGSVVRAGYLVASLRGRGSPWRAIPAGTFRPALVAHLRFALPIAATFFSAQASTSVCMLIFASYDVYQFAALTLILPWINVAGTFGMSWAQATGIAVAQHLGRGGGRAELDAFLKMAWRGAMVSGGMVALAYLGIILSANDVYATLEPQTRAALWTFLPTLLLLPWPKNSNAICGNTLRAAGRTVYVMHIFLWSQWAFKVPLSAFLVLVIDAPVGWVLSLYLFEEILKVGPFHYGLLRGAWRDRLPG